MAARPLELPRLSPGTADLAAGRWGALSVPNYRTYFFASAVSQSGGWLLRTAQAWLVLDLTGSPAALGALALFQFLPITILTLFAGVLVDRVASRWLLVTTQLVIAAQSGLPEYPSISLSHKTSLHKCCPGRAANSAGHGPTGMLAKVDGLSILLWG